jgi:predicted dehydrogenase
VYAVLIATPEHWHALQTIMACQAGKDVYVEKPLSLTVREGGLMIRAARKYRRIVQVGTQQRSGEHFQRAVELVRNGTLGQVCHVSCAVTGNKMPGWGSYPDSAPPPELDWDLWLGPTPTRPYNPLRCHYNFRWFWDTGGGQMTNWGPHHLDTARWMLNERAATMVTAVGRRFALQDIGETPDVQDAIFNFPSGIVQLTIREMNGSSELAVQVHGTKATLTITRAGFRVDPETWGSSNLGRGRPKEETPKRMAEPLAVQSKGYQGLTTHDAFELTLELAHIRNFLDCVRSRQRPAADVEEGHLSATLCHLANISTRLRRSLRWNPEHEDFIDDADASRMLSRPYRAPWRLPEV